MSTSRMWRMHLGMALFWLAALGALYWGMERWLEPAGAKVLADGSVHLQRHRDGHFYADGRVNGQAVRFMLDTGASAIAVTDALAKDAGLQGGQRTVFRTANGERVGRMVMADEVQVGPLRVQQLMVGTGYTGNQPHHALLGQNFLRHFDVVMRGESLTLHPRSPSYK